MNGHNDLYAYDNTTYPFDVSAVAYDNSSNYSTIPITEYNTDTILDSLCSTEHYNPPSYSDYKPLLEMKEELINYMKEDTSSDIKLDETIATFLDDTSDKMIKFFVSFKKQQQTMDTAEFRMKEAIDKNKRDIELLTTFIDFLSKLKNNYDLSGNDENIQQIKQNIDVVTAKIKNETTIVKAKETYIQEKKKFHKFLNILKLFNHMNVGSTCSICLTTNVDMFFDPCGHTACSRCCEKIKEKKKCPLCRKNIIYTRKLYFT
jgi:hypothetical protein